MSPGPNEICRRKIAEWLGDMWLAFGPATITALLRVARVAEEMAEEQIAKAHEIEYPDE
jgi:hypothetical protein